MNDAELLLDYVRTGSEEAVTELIRRHINLVYGTARRQLRDPHLAQEISQQVFCALIKQAKSIREPGRLPAWLYRTTCQLVTMHVRTEQRRMRRETTAASMNTASENQQNF